MILLNVKSKEIGYAIFAGTHVGIRNQFCYESEIKIVILAEHHKVDLTRLKGL